MKEIFHVKHNKYMSSTGVECVLNYFIGQTGWADGENLTPQKITIRKDRVVVLFAELGITHEFAFTEDVEIYRRDKVEEDADKTTD